ncbi:hypothetical protein Emag_004205 [Eimeria magna]
MSKKNNRHARQRRQQHLILQEKAEEKKRDEKLKKKHALRDITQLLDSVELAPQSQTPKDASRKGPQEKPRSTIYQKVVSEAERGGPLLGLRGGPCCFSPQRALFSGRTKQRDGDEMETDDPASSSSSSSGKGGIFSGVRTLKAISKKKAISSKLGGEGSRGHFLNEILKRPSLSLHLTAAAAAAAAALGGKTPQGPQTLFSLEARRIAKRARQRFDPVRQGPPCSSKAAAGVAPCCL